MSAVSPHCVRVTDPALLSATDVREWFGRLLKAGINFHPDDHPCEIVTGDVSEAAGDYAGNDRWYLYNDLVANAMSAAMDEAMEICRTEGVDIYEIACNEFDLHMQTRRRRST